MLAGKAMFNFVLSLTGDSVSMKYRLKATDNADVNKSLIVTLNYLEALLISWKENKSLKTHFLTPVRFLLPSCTGLTSTFVVSPSNTITGIIIGAINLTIIRFQIGIAGILIKLSGSYLSAD